jgi:arsenate reductase-like glutaredoxin family protein
MYSSKKIFNSINALSSNLHKNCLNNNSKKYTNLNPLSFKKICTNEIINFIVCLEV